MVHAQACSIGEVIMDDDKPKVGQTFIVARDFIIIFKRKMVGQEEILETQEFEVGETIQHRGEHFHVGYPSRPQATWTGAHADGRKFTGRIIASHLDRLQPIPATKPQNTHGAVDR